MDPSLQQHSLSHFASFPQETSIKPSQVPKLLSHPAPRRGLPLQTPEECNMNKLSPNWHPSGMKYPAALISSSSANIVSPVNSLLKDRLGPLKPFPPSHGDVLSSPVNGATSAREYLGPQHNMIRLDSGYFTSPQVVLASQIKTHMSAERTFIPTIFNSPSPQFGKSISNPLPSCLFRRDQGTESKIPFSNSGKNKDVSQREDPRKTHQHEQTCSRESNIPVTDLNSTSQKRRREWEPCLKNIKKPCHKGINHGTTETNRLIPGTSPRSSLDHQPSPQSSSVFESSHETTKRLLKSEPACSALSSTPKSSRLVLVCPKKMASTGAKKGFITTENNIVKLRLTSTLSEGSPKNQNEENQKKNKSSPSKVHHKECSKPPHVGSVCNNSNSGCSVPVKTESKKLEGISPKPASKPSLSSSSCSTPERSKASRIRKPTLVLDDIDQLFTPDPNVYVIRPACKAPKCRVEEQTIKSPTSKKGSSCSPTVTAISSPATQPLHAASSPASNVTVFLPTVTLERLKLEESQRCPKDGGNRHGSVKGSQLSTKDGGIRHGPVQESQLSPKDGGIRHGPVKESQLSPKDGGIRHGPVKESQFSPKDGGIRHGPVNSSRSQSKDESFKPQHNLSLKPKISEGLRCSETDTAASVQETSLQCTKPPLVEEEDSDGSKGGKEEDSIDVELDLGLSISYDIDPSQSSDSSEEEEPLISLQEMMECVAKPPDTPQKEAVSEPSTPGCRSSQSKTSLLSSSTKPGVYKNNLDQMLKEINSTKKAKEMEAQLLSACNEDLLRLAEYEAAEENQEEVANEHQEFLQHFSLMSGAIKEIPPGEMVFNLERFGQIFQQDSLQLRQCHVIPQGASQKTLIWSSPAQLRLHLIVGLFEEAYCNSPCPAQVTRFLFKMMSVHSERIISNKILQALCDIACSAAYQIVNSDNQKFEVWVPSLADVTLVFMNMGAAFVTLFPFESLQPSFTEGDLLEDVYFQNESPSNNEEISFPEHNCTNILKYLSYCMGLCPRAYSNDELLLLLTVVGRISLDTRQILQSNVSVSCLMYTIISNIRDWSSMLPRVCKALTDLTDDHHNMCLLVQLLPDSKRGIELRRHLSMCFISKLLDGHCTYVPVETELSLAELRPYLPQMQPSALLRSIQQKDKEEEMATQDQQAYYLCYSLLTLTNEASNLQVFKPQQKGQLLVLSSELETHVKCDIRESEKCLYRSKVKDLVARIYTKWQMLLQKTRPLNGKLYDYWQPVETFGTEDDEEAAVFVEDNVETIIINENDTLIADDKEEENKNTEVKEDMEVDEHPGDKEDDTKARETTAAEEQVTGDLN